MDDTGATSLEAALRSLAGVERVLTWNWDPSSSEAGAGPRAEPLPSREALPRTPSNAVLLRMPLDDLSPDYIASLHGAIVEGGKLVVLDPDRARNEERLRECVRVLSEGGFALGHPPALTERGHLLVARRDAFTLRPYRSGDDEGIGKLFRESFHVERPAADWRWKYHESPFGNDLVALAVSPEGEIACHYGGYPVPFFMTGREPLLALQMGDTMTGPRFRRIGRGASSLLARTVRYFFALHRPGRFAFFYGFNRGAIQRFCEWFIGGYEVADVHYLERVENEPSASTAPREIEADYEVRLLTERLSRGELDELDHLFARAAPDYGFLARRDAAYLKWRYLDAPGSRFALLGAYHRGALVGWSVFSENDGVMTWGDALVDRAHRGAAGVLLAEARSRLSPSRTVAWFPPRPTWWAETLEALDFLRRPEPQGLKLMVLADAIGPGDMHRLYYAKGDGDLF